MALPLMLLGNQDSTLVQAMMDAVGLGDLGERLLQQVSVSQLQCVAIARALIHASKLLLADEPTGNLDPRNAERVMDVLIHQVRASGAAMMLVIQSVAPPAVPTDADPHRGRAC